MDRLLQGVDEDTGRPYVLFGKVKIQTLPNGFRVEDERDGSVKEFADRKAALAAVGLPENVLDAADGPAPERAIVAVRSLISEVELRALDRVAKGLGLSREAAIRRAIATFVLEQG